MQPAPLTRVSDKELLEWAVQIVILPFYEKTEAKLREITLRKLVEKKNPYLFAMKPSMGSAEDIAKAMLDASLSSSEETISGNLMEALAIKVNNAIFGGHKAPEGEYPGIDLIFERHDTRHYVGIKSGPVWGNNSQVAKLRQDFAAARKKGRDEGWVGAIECINGCIYGPSATHQYSTAESPDQNYQKIVGEAFWEFVSGEPGMHKRVMQAIQEAKKTNKAAYAGAASAYEAKVSELADELRAKLTQGSDADLDMRRIFDFHTEEDEDPEGPPTS